MNSEFSGILMRRTLWVLIKAFILGLVLAETSHFILTIYIQFITQKPEAIFPIAYEFFFTLCIVIPIAGFLFFGGWKMISRVVQSRRFDLLLSFFLGAIASMLFSTIGNRYYPDIVTTITPLQLRFLFALPAVLTALVLLKYILSRNAAVSPAAPSLFLNDEEKHLSTDDLLGIAERADQFAEKVLNHNSSDSLVFGIDAPWGTGKSTFVNFCERYWRSQHSVAMVFRFRPLQFDDRNQLLTQFLDSFVRSVRREIFLPELQPIMNKYKRLIKAQSVVAPFTIELDHQSATIDDAHECLRFMLSTTKRKIIVVIDDIDRLEMAPIKDILFIVKANLDLPNVSHIICYDSANIAAKEEVQAEKTAEFLEKFINVKMSLYIDSAVLKAAMSALSRQAERQNPFAKTPITSHAYGALAKIYDSTLYHSYLPFLGDLRKIKKLINTMLLLDVHRVNLDIVDFDPSDLMNLLLIYITYPHVFRKIYAEETDGKRGYFSATYSFDNNYPKDAQSPAMSRRQGDAPRNSVQYTAYVQRAELGAALLLNQVFDLDTRLDSFQHSSFTQDAARTYACFNGSIFSNDKESRNLERYLKLIVSLEIPRSDTQFRRYSTFRDRIVRGESIDTILLEPTFTECSDEFTHKQLWPLLSSDSSGLSSTQAEKLIDHILDKIHLHSILSVKDLHLGLRNDLPFYLANLLNNAGWADEDRERSNNSDENVAQIAYYVFGEKGRSGRGFVDVLMDDKRGILGVYDLLKFRFECCSGVNNLFDLQRALVQHHDPNGQTTGIVTGIAIAEMREITQRLFIRFSEQFIVEKKNLFKLVDELTLDDLAGHYGDSLKRIDQPQKVDDLAVSVARMKTYIMNFIVYQLRGTFTDNGVGCGYYDESGNHDSNGIAQVMIDYMFDVCFSPRDCEDNFEHFLDYLLANFSMIISNGRRQEYVADKNRFEQLLGRESLSSYWQKHGADIKSKLFESRSKEIYTYNYLATYKENLKGVYQALDEIVSG